MRLKPNSGLYKQERIYIQDFNLHLGVPMMWISSSIVP